MSVRRDRRRARRKLLAAEPAYRAKQEGTREDRAALDALVAWEMDKATHANRLMKLLLSRATAATTPPAK